LEVDEQREKVGEQRRPAVSVWWSFTRLDSEERKASLQNRREQVKEARHPLSFLVFLLIIFFSLNNFFFTLGQAWALAQRLVPCFILQPYKSFFLVSG
jgi:hypothetical protein